MAVSSSYLFVLPIVVFVLFMGTFLLTLTIAVLLGHVEPVFPYISDTGTYSPESCIFGQLINFGTLLFACVVYLRWRQANELCTLYDFGTCTKCLNIAAAIVGYVSCIGINVVANFQERAVFWVHLIAATLGFGFGAGWLVLQALLSYRLYPMASAALWLLRMRILISFLCICCYFICAVTGVLSFFAFKGKDFTHWRKEDGGWELHVASTICEWLTVILAITFILTFSGEFRRVRLHSPKVDVEVAGLLT